MDKWVRRLERNKDKAKDEFILTWKALGRAIKTWLRYPDADPFFYSLDWQYLRLQVIRKYGRRCMRCQATDRPIHVDHIKPRSKYPHLALKFHNLQVLCQTCNLEKGNHDETDFRQGRER